MIYRPLLKYVGRLLNVSSKKVTFELNEEIDISRMSRYANGDNIFAGIEFRDNRLISRPQQQFANALMRDMAAFKGYTPIEIEKDTLYWLFEKEQGLEEGSFSTSDCSMTVASLFIKFLIRTCFEERIPFKNKNDILPETTEYFLFCCLVHNQCFVCGKEHAETAHYEAVGSGRNRKHIDHRKHRFMKLCGGGYGHHREQHDIGIETFCKKYLIKPLAIDDKMAIKLKLMTQKQIDEFDKRYKEESVRR